MSRIQGAERECRPAARRPTGLARVIPDLAL
jgi:hypothetical protein